MRYEPALLPTVDRSGDTADGFERGGDRGHFGAVVRRGLGGWRWRVVGTPGQRVLLPLWDVEGSWWMREDVRDAEVCVALVGDVLRDSEEQGCEGCVESGAAVSSAGAGGAGCRRCAGCGDERFALEREAWFVIRDLCSASRQNSLQRKLVAGG